MKTEHVYFQCGEIELEGQLQFPDNHQKAPAVIVCHPHPLYGGDMDNNVVLIICNAIVEKGSAALRFNFRGVGRSGGRFGGGIKEREDVKAAVDYLKTRQEIDANDISLVGYSFGGSVAFQTAAEDKRVKRLALISPALDDPGWEDLTAYPNPKLILIGDSDEVVSFSRVKRYFTANKDFQVVAGADHFWRGYEHEVGARIGKFVKSRG
ncbi:MAG: hypothetical protein A2Z74_02770 [Chloroflexi bacterium RBG_13_46_9]|nr:MAG: hypothetical protein A2Z74_02770 [Chloroflexi bacterium RBG_13_46_9]